MARRTRLDDIPCSIARSLDVLGEWWTPLVLRDIFYGLRRFEQIATDLPIARNILADRLKTLVEAEILEKRRYDTAPDRYEYVPTEKGEATFSILLALMAWGDEWANPEGVPPVSVLCRACEQQSEPVVACRECGEPMSPRTVGVRPNLGQDTPRARLVLSRQRSTGPE